MTRRELLLNYGVLTNGWSSPKIKKRKFLNEVANTEKKTHIRRHTEQRHDIVLLLSTWYNVAACVVVLWPKSLYLYRMKNQPGHWVCWMSTSTYIPGGVVDYPRAYKNQIREFNSHRVNSHRVHVVHASRDFLLHKKWLAESARAWVSDILWKSTSSGNAEPYAR